MPTTLTMPKLSPTMEGGTVVKWHKKEGDLIKSGVVLFEVATDKATVEYEALDEGVLRQILVKEGEEALVNQPVAVFTATADESLEGYQPEGQPLPSGEPQPEEKKEEAKVSFPAEDNTPTPPAATLATMAFEPEPPLEDYAFESEASGHGFVSPLAKKLAKEKGLDVTTVQGSGPHGRVMSRDLNLAQKEATASFGSRKTPHKAPGSYVTEKLSPMRKAIAERLQASKMSIPHFYVQHEVAVESMIALRAQLKEHGVKVTFNDFIVRAAALALREHPEVNSGFHAAKQEILRFKTIDVAVAVSVPSGLITPIVRHADYKNLGQLSVEIKQLSLLAKEGKLQPHQYRGGSFTTSNLGMFGIRDFQAVINPPQAAILAIGGMRECPVVSQGQVTVGKKMTLSLSSDHRVVDGADAARFLVTMQKLLEAPAILLVS